MFPISAIYLLYTQDNSCLEPKMVSKGLWSVWNVMCLPWMYRWTFVTAKIISNDSLLNLGVVLYWRSKCSRSVRNWFVRSIWYIVQNACSIVIRAGVASSYNVQVRVIIGETSLILTIASCHLGVHSQSLSFFRSLFKGARKLCILGINTWY